MYIEVRSRTIQIKRERNNSVNSQSVNKSEKRKKQLWFDCTEKVHNVNKAFSYSFSEKKIIEIHKQ